MGRDLRATWSQALLTFFTPLVIFFALRWAVVEPYVIPSGSMLPNLLIHDHIVVNKLAFGLRWPFSDQWITHWSHPRRGDIVVFRYPKNPDVFYVKRVVGVAGDQLELREGVLWVNGEPLSSEPMSAPTIPDVDEEFHEGFEYRQEPGRIVRYRNSQMASEGPFEVPAGHFFVIGDNRDQSSDSRSWGPVPEDHLLGRAVLVWLSCEETLPTAPFICDPKALRWGRWMTRIQ